MTKKSKLGEVHLLLIEPKDLEGSFESIRKQARKLAMTGGYELELSDSFDLQELSRLCELCRLEMHRYPAGSSEQRASIAGRLLSKAEGRLLDFRER